MKNKTVLLYVLILLLTACNLPGNTAIATSSPLPGITDPEQPPAPTLTSVPTQLPTPLPSPTSTPPPSDLPFTIDCSALPASRQVDCDSFIAATRDQVYPIYREVTGVSLSKCYKEIHYVILSTDPGQGAGGLSAGDTITYNQKYSIDLPHRYDVHELLHSINACTKALDFHVMHGMVMNYVYDRLGVHDLGYFDPRSSDNLTIGLDMQLEKVKTASGQDLINNCKGILMRKTTIAFFDLGAQSAQAIYQSTVPPLKIAAQPNSSLVNVWGTAAPQIQALLETLEQDYKYSIDVPKCGY